MTRRLSIIATRKEIELNTSFDYPPIPFRGHDWSAIDSNTFDADYDYNAECYVSKCPQGSGETEIEAINDLLEQIEERVS